MNDLYKTFIQSYYRRDRVIVRAVIYQQLLANQRHRRGEASVHLKAAGAARRKSHSKRHWAAAGRVPDLKSVFRRKGSDCKYSPFNTLKRRRTKVMFVKKSDDDNRLDNNRPAEQQLRKL